MMTEIIKILICVVVCALATFLQNITNAKKLNRVRQPLMPAYAFIFSVVSAIFCYDKLTASFDLIIVENFMLSFNIAFVNATVLGSYLSSKLAVRPIITAFWKKKSLIEKTNFGFYEFDDEYEEWFLKQKWVNFRKFMLAIVIGVTAITGVFLGLTWVLGSRSFIWVTSLPVCAMIVINELYGFVNGQTKEEFLHNIYGDEADSRRVSNFYKVRDVLEQLLPEPLITAHTGLDYAGKQTPTELLKQLSESEDPIDKVTAQYFKQDRRCKSAEVDCVRATEKLMHRQNVVFFNPFYRDAGFYITLPLVNVLLSGKKCVVVTGRMSNCDDVCNWLTELLSSYSHMNRLWRVGKLSEKDPEFEVGIIGFPQLYDEKIIATNRSFLNETDFVLLIEPSVVVNTGQVALSILAQEMHKNDEYPVYCVCDRITDGLVDTLSHVLHAEFTDVIAAPVPRCIYIGMNWDADGDFTRQQLFDKQTRFLGNGVELAAIAVKNQIPEVYWYGENSVPLKDIKWIAGQHYSTICKYMNIPVQQKSLYEKIKFEPTMWSTEKEKEKFLIAQDEFCNMFSTMRAFLSRGTTQSFINILSENYMLRDYMRCNTQLFMSNPNAIPSIVPDYSKTERNTLIKLLLTMVYRPVTDKEILDEFHLVGVEAEDGMDILTDMLRRYTCADNTIFTIKTVRTEVSELATMSVNQYSIEKELFDEIFSESFRHAYFIVEDERYNEAFIDAKMFSHVTQLVLPGQFTVYDGKYYLVKHVSPQSGVVLRRASDLYDGRKYYRQARRYILKPATEEELVSCRTVMDVEVAFLRKDIDVETDGYLEMNNRRDLRSARFVDLSKDPSVSHFTRNYRNKTIMRIKLPDTNINIRFTLCMLLSEAFTSIFPDGSPYLAVVAKRPDNIGGVLNNVVYEIYGDIEDDYIYIIEDSDIDLGLLGAVDRNLMKIFEIIADFLEWHFEKMREPESKDPVPVSIISKMDEEARKRQTLFAKMAAKISGIFGGTKDDVKIMDDPDTVIRKPEKKKKPVAVKTDTKGEKVEPLETAVDGAEPENDGSMPAVDTGIGTSADAGDYETASEKAEKAEPEEKVKEKVPVMVAPVSEEKEEDFLPDDTEDPDIVHIDGTDIFENDGMAEDEEMFREEFERLGITPIKPSRYQKYCFLKFGFDEIDSRLVVEDVRNYLRVRGWCNNALTKARKRDVLVKTNLDTKTENHCDFCSLPLSGVSYDMLNDGRVRCNDCSSSAISTIEDFRQLFFQILELMEALYGVKYRVPIHVKMADARTIAKGTGCVFVPTTKVAGRALGYAQKKRGKYGVVIENGAPRLASIDTMVHELTHIWQYLNWDKNEIAAMFSMRNSKYTAMAVDIVYEGMAMWASIQYLYQIGETYFAAQQEAQAESRPDIYGLGFCLYREHYPLIKDASSLKYTPFMQKPPIDPARVRAILNALMESDEA